MHSGITPVGNKPHICLLIKGILCNCSGIYYFNKQSQTFLSVTIYKVGFFKFKRILNIGSYLSGVKNTPPQTYVNTMPAGSNNWFVHELTGNPWTSG